MNSVLNVMSTTHVDINELRELSHAEKTTAGGRSTCYKAPKGFSNPYRYVQNGGGAVEEKYERGRYVNKRFFANVANFRLFCERGGYNFFY
jgi:hypothetical protein